MFRFYVEEIDLDEAAEYKEELSAFSLWYPDLEEAGVSRVFVAVDDSHRATQIVGFQTVNLCHQCVAIEVLPEYQGKGIATKLIDFSGCSRPERNENKDFWGKVSLLEEVVFACNLDNLGEVKKYLPYYQVTKIKGHLIVLAVCQNREVIFSVDGMVETDNLDVCVGAVIFRWLKKAWEELLIEIQNREDVNFSSSLFCYPTETDGAFHRRKKAFSKVGFQVSENDPERMFYSL